MANNKSQKSSGNGHGKTHAVVLGDATEAIKLTNAGKARVRQDRTVAENQRLQQLAQGNFYSRLNVGRNSDIAELTSGVLGEYAFPGGNQPSAHFRVVNAVIRDNTIPVVYFESAQRGHELTGKEWNTGTYVPLWHITKFGDDYSSNRSGLQGKTQEMIAQYVVKLLKEDITKKAAAARAQSEAERLADEEDRRQQAAKRREEANQRAEQLIAQNVKKASDLEAERFQNASTDMKQLYNWVPGEYKTPQDLVVTLLPNGRLKVLRSVEGSKLEAGTEWFILFNHCFMTMQKKSAMMSDRLYNWQCELHAFMQLAFAGINKVEPKPTEATPVVVSQMKVEVMVPKLPAFNVAGAKKLNDEAFLGQIGKYSLTEGSHKAYFEVTVIGGAKAVSLRRLQKGFDESHFLFALLKHHEKVTVDLGAIDTAKDSGFSDLANEKHAREALRIFLRRVKSTVVKPKKQADTQKSEQHTATISKDKVQGLSERFHVRQQPQGQAVH